MIKTPKRLSDKRRKYNFYKETNSSSCFTLKSSLSIIFIIISSFYIYFFYIINTHDIFIKTDPNKVVDSIIYLDKDHNLTSHNAYPKCQPPVNVYIVISIFILYKIFIYSMICPFFLYERWNLLLVL